MPSLNGLTVESRHYDLASVSALNGVLLVADTSGYDYAVLQVAPAAGQTLPTDGTLVFEATVDMINWTVLPCVPVAGGVLATSLAAETAAMVVIPTPGLSFRVRLSEALVARPAKPFVNVMLNKGPLNAMITA